MSNCVRCACGDGKSGYSGSDPVAKELCVVFCQARKEFCENKKKGKTKPRPSKIAENKMKTPEVQRRMNRAISRSPRGYARGASAIPEKRMMVPWNKAVPKSWRRSPMTPGRIRSMLKPVRERIERQIKQKVQDVLKKKIAKKAATSWMKLVPGLNVISTAYDIYDLATTGYDLYKMIDGAMDAYTASGAKVFEIRPDVAIEGPDGAVQDIYDFKFDGDSPGNNPGQTELYREATNGKNPNWIDQKSCKCK